jgi:hypothetical protein
MVDMGGEHNHYKKKRFLIATYVTEKNKKLLQNIQMLDFLQQFCIFLSDI